MDKNIHLKDKKSMNRFFNKYLINSCSNKIYKNIVNDNISTKWFKKNAIPLNNLNYSKKVKWINDNIDFINYIYNILLKNCLNIDIVIIDNEENFDSFCDMLFYNSSNY